ncbi:helix-turn-helix domain-containing protein [Bosea sp. LjRoot90]|uniref:MerR family transcriptional regulator n=1 Tax=Bosea sp. LjRoot90 TaxID=3342342 RepID=UPI003ECDF445
MVPIGTLAERTGVKVETIRYYEQVGLLPEPERSEGNQRRYGRAHIERLAFIKHARDLGFAVDSIRTLLRLSDTPGMACDEAHAISAGHLKEVRDKIARLRSLEAELARIATVCSGGVAACDCAIIEALADHAQCEHHNH